ncbi:MAG TPA: hypothetical protein VFQ82_06315, partial [Stellaceae bacterium]|nr:hypothetical protein [Stellaceae bacterium]
SGRVLPEYAQIVFLYYLKSKRFRRAAPITTNMAHLTLERLKPMEFPLPSTEEQMVIVRRYREAQALIDETLIAGGSRERDALRQSVLKSAFEGRLVAQDPADEPASALLARLRESAAAPSGRRGGRRNPRSPNPFLPGLVADSGLAPARRSRRAISTL